MAPENDPRPLYVEARRVLLDALTALAPHGGAVIVAGAQAIYLRTGEAAFDFAIAAFTLDSDLALNPSLLGDDPNLEAAMRGAHFELLPQPEGHYEPGIWITHAMIEGKREPIPVDLIVPQGASDSGRRRGARLGTHGNRAARLVVGLEAALVDHGPMQVTALDPADVRSITAEVAGPAALVVAKAHKVNDRVAAGKTERIKNKDASDVVRLMQTTPASTLAVTLARLAKDPLAGQPTRDALVYLNDLFGRRGGAGIAMASDAFQFVLDPETVEVICTSYVRQLRDSLGEVDS
jgi:hypothetical protein